MNYKYPLLYVGKNYQEIFRKFFIKELNLTSWEEIYYKLNDIVLVFPEREKITIDQIRDVIHKDKIGLKWAIILEPNLMNKEAANALLKTLEEPQSLKFTLFTNSEKLLDTIKSRCFILKSFHVKTFLDKEKLTLRISDYKKIAPFKVPQLQEFINLDSFRLWLEDFFFINQSLKVDFDEIFSIDLKNYQNKLLDYLLQDIEPKMIDDKLKKKLSSYIEGIFIRLLKTVSWNNFRVKVKDYNWKLKLLTSYLEGEYEGE